MMIFVACLLTADGSVYATIKTQPVPAEHCLRWKALKSADATARYDCIPAEARNP
ncbi:hypothetical protein ABIA16_003770 [Sinorhizobium fredii]